MLSYVPSILGAPRRLTREVRVGDVVIGGKNPVVVQSMTTTPTTDVAATVEQIRKLVEVGCQIVRVTVPTQSDMDAVPKIRERMKAEGLRVPLVADIHFLPKLALQACDWFEKVRINPGNFADRKKFEVLEYTDAEYQEEIDRIRETFRPIVLRAKENGIAMRIGTNHGSLSDRIMNRFGDTPMGMVESALEFIRIAQDEGYRDLVISMKSSNPQVMIQAYRLLVSRMNESGMDYPLHLGVTEAGDGDDGRIKSAMGIGSLLADGLGDTIRVSLTEDPEREIPVARRLNAIFEKGFDLPAAPVLAPAWDFYSYQRRATQRYETKGLGLGGREPVRVLTHVPLSGAPALAARSTEPYVEAVSLSLDPPVTAERMASIDSKLPVRVNLDATTLADLRPGKIPFDEIGVAASSIWSEPGYVEKISAVLEGKTVWLRARETQDVDAIVRTLHASSSKVRFGVSVESYRILELGRRVAATLTRAGFDVPMHLCLVSKAEETKENLLLRAPVEIGALLCDGIGDSVEIRSGFGVDFNHVLGFDILQAARLRMSKTEYIACPSCGRTLFDLQETTAKIRARTGHLKGVKIAVMGCIVNGPGEMADADFGYVGSGVGQINLYVGKDCVERHIPQSDAVEKLVDLIKSHDRWIEPTA